MQRVTIRKVIPNGFENVVTVVFNVTYFMVMSEEEKKEENIFRYSILNGGNIVFLMFYKIVIRFISNFRFQTSLPSAAHC